MTRVNVTINGNNRPTMQDFCRESAMQSDK